MLRKYFFKNIRRRGTVLAIFSLVFLAIGIKSLIDPAPDLGRFMAYAQLPSIARFIMWTIPAILGLISAFRPVPKRDAIGFGALAIPCGVMIASYGGTVIGYFLGFTDFNSGWVNMLEWVLILTLLFVISGWMEADELIPPKYKDE